MPVSVWPRSTDRDDLPAYLAQRPEAEFFISPFVDYASADGMFRKYRIVIVDGKALCLPHGDRRGMEGLVPECRHGAERAAPPGRSACSWKTSTGFRRAPRTARWRKWRHASGWIISRSIARKPADGALLVFEADNTAIVHDMDPPSVYPYKSAQMQKIFAAVQAMLLSPRRPAGGAA